MPGAPRSTASTRRTRDSIPSDGNEGLPDVTLDNARTSLDGDEGLSASGSFGWHANGKTSQSPATGMRVCRCRRLSARPLPADEVSIPSDEDEVCRTTHRRSGPAAGPHVSIPSDGDEGLPGTRSSSSRIWVDCLNPQRRG